MKINKEQDEEFDKRFTQQYIHSKVRKETIEEITYMLSEYRKELVIQEKKHSDYLNKLKEEFTNELIIMSLIK